MTSVDISSGITIHGAGSTFTRAPAEILAYLAAQPAGIEAIRQAAATTDLCADVAAFVGDGLNVSAVVDWTTGQLVSLRIYRQ